MRRRLLISTLIVAVTAVLLLGVPLAVVMRSLVINESGTQLTGAATDAATDLQYRLDHHYPQGFDEVGHSLPGDYVVIYENGKVVRRFGTAPPVHHVTRGYYTSRRFKVVVETGSSTVYGHVTDAMLLVVALSLLAVGVAVGLAFFQVRRFTRPLEELASAAVLLGSGDARPVGRRYSLPELDQVAAALDDSARRLADLLAAEREFASDASHQLRTPLTALSMRL
ncbi:MAG: two-component sensor histidine kinase, partial [Streptosporangiaceae bacterium]